MWCCSIVTESLGTAYYNRLLNLICTEPTYQCCSQYKLAKFRTGSGWKKAVNITIQIGGFGGFQESSHPVVLNSNYKQFPLICRTSFFLAKKSLQRLTCMTDP